MIEWLQLGYRVRWGKFGRYLWLSEQIPGWLRGVEARELAHASSGLPEDAVVVEIGSFLGSSAVLLAGARKLRGSGKIHCIDPFDGSGDEYSVPIYRSLQQASGLTARACFDRNLKAAGLGDWIEVYPATGCEIARRWTQPLDMLLLDGDHSYEGVHSTYTAWAPFLKPGGVLVVPNSRQRPQPATHDGSMRVVAEMVRPPAYSDVRLVRDTTFAIRTTVSQSRFR